MTPRRGARVSREAELRRRSFASIASLLLATFLTACGAPTASPGSAGLASSPAQTADPQSRWDQTLQAAKGEGKVVVVTHTNLYYQKMVQAFGEKYPDIQVAQVAQ